MQTLPGLGHAGAGQLRRRRAGLLQRQGLLPLLRDHDEVGEEQVRTLKQRFSQLIFTILPLTILPIAIWPDAIEQLPFK